MLYRDVSSFLTENRFRANGKKNGRVLRRYADIPVSTGYLMVPKKLEKVEELISFGGLLCSCIRDTQLQDI